ncbi:MAG: cation:proton antiporter, partial [Gemmatimonadaceae bacterium]|nr:cation:proton antiporter [Gemmatimonadaceae bacterium]
MAELRALFESELGYVVLLFGLFVVPKVLQRWRLPSAITAFVLGAVVGISGGPFREDRTLHLLSTFGISALFLFAGLEVDFHALRARLRVLAQHLGVRVAMLALAAWAGAQLFGLEGRAAVLLA